MLFGIVDTCDRGKFIFGKFPRNRPTLDISSKITSSEVSEKLLQYFHYFGFFTKKCALKIGANSYSEQCLIEIVNPSEKKDSVIMGIDEQCVLVSQSILFDRQETGYEEPPTDFFYFSYEKQQKKRKKIINSLTLVWILKDFDMVQSIQNQLCFLLRAIEKKQLSEMYLSQQIILLTEIKKSYEKKVAQKAGQILKDSNSVFDELDAKQIFLNFEQNIDRDLQQVQIFSLLYSFYLAVNNEQSYKIPGQHWIGVSQGKYQISREIDKHDEHLIQKQVIMVQKQLDELPAIMKDERVLKIAKQIIKQENKSIRQLVKNQKNKVRQRNYLFTLNFITENKIGKPIYPFDRRKYISAYGIRKLPSWGLVRKFNGIFKKQHLLIYLHNFSNIEMIKKMKPQLKYILLKDLLSQIDICLYHLPQLHSQWFSQQKQAENSHQAISHKNVEQYLNPVIVNHIVSQYGDHLGDKPLIKISEFLERNDESSKGIPRKGLRQGKNKSASKKNTFKRGNNWGNFYVER